jgi:hypothetical protein|tara:strand:- start:319 stop:462 length:144 start_codon:yes stop_codon:yes gene_type:complete
VNQLGVTGGGGVSKDVMHHVRNTILASTTKQKAANKIDANQMAVQLC